MTSAGWTSSEKLFRPFHLAALQVQAIKQVMQRLFFRESLFLEFGDVLVAVLSAGLWQLRFAIGGYGGYVHLTARHDWRRPAASGDLERPLHVLGLRPTFGEPRMSSDRI